jgi:hypothetical protein
MEVPKDPARIAALEGTPVMLKLPRMIVIVAV